MMQSTLFLEGLLTLFLSLSKKCYEAFTSGESLRYEPEQNMTVEGSVWPVHETNKINTESVRFWPIGQIFYNPSKRIGTGIFINPETTFDASDTSDNYEQEPETPSNDFDPYFGVDNNGLRKPVTVEGELVFPDDIATIKMETSADGHFKFATPPYYGQAILFLRASKSEFSEEKRQKKRNKGALDEIVWPDFYVKRDIFYPVFAKKYDCYQCHVPEIVEGTDFDDYTILDTARISKMDQTLREVKVKGKHHRGRHAIDYSKPAYVYDTFDLYNLVTDRGLSFGHFEASRFPIQIAYALLGNYNSDRALQVAARLNDMDITPYIFYRNFDPGPTVNLGMDSNGDPLIAGPCRSDMWVVERIKLNRQSQIRLFTDFELRNEDRPVPMESTVADVTLDYMLLPNDSKRYTYRDRRIILDGMYLPDEFYHPDYSQRPLEADIRDYRRTLYWNPNARLNEEGRFAATFYNNGKPTRIRVTTAGIITNDVK